MTHTVFITGGTSGIGLELAKIYLKNGWRVGVCGRDEDKFQHAFDSRKERVEFFKVDVADREALRNAILIFSKPTGLGVMIANAGISYPHKTKVPDFDRSYKMVGVNLLGTMYAFEAALEVMLPQGGGQLVAIASLAGYNGLPGTSAYSATKAAVMKLCESLGMDLESLGITVTCACPGFVDTPLTKANHHPMPFLLNAPEAAQRIYRGIEKKKAWIIFPFFFGLFVRFLSILPRRVYRFIMKSKPFNFSRENRPKEIAP